MSAGRIPSHLAPLTLEVALAPIFVPSDPAARARTTYVVVDVIRATTTLGVILERGCRRVLVAPGIAEARAVQEQSLAPYLLGGESGGVAPAGFDFGNSPREYALAALDGREIVFATTNGTRALRACAGGFAIYAGCFRNAGAVARAAVRSASEARADGRAQDGRAQDGRAQDGLATGHPPAAGGHAASDATTDASMDATTDASMDASTGASEAGYGDQNASPDIVVVCAGRYGEPSYDDTLCAGYLIDRIVAEAAARDLGTTVESGAQIALAACRFVMQRPDGLRTALAESGAGRATRAVGLQGDLDWCAEIDATSVVPYVTAFDAERDLLELHPYPRASEGNAEAEGVG